jgi:ribosomal protein S27E
MKTVSTWRCKCGASIKVVSELDRDQPSETRQVACPKCGDEQKVYAHTIISVTTQQVVSFSG